MEAVNEWAMYFGLMMAFAAGMTAWRLAAAKVKVQTQVDGLLGICLVLSTGAFILAMVPGAQL